MKMRPRLLVLLAAPGGAALALALSSGHVSAAGLPGVGGSGPAVPQVTVNTPVGSVSAGPSGAKANVSVSTPAGSASAQANVSAGHAGASASVSAGASAPGQTTVNASASAGTHSAPAASVTVNTPAASASVSTAPAPQVAVSAAPASATVSTTPGGTPPVSAHVTTPSQPVVPAASQPVSQPAALAPQAPATTLVRHTSTPHASAATTPSSSVFPSPAGRPAGSVSAAFGTVRIHRSFAHRHPAGPAGSAAIPARTTVQQVRTPAAHGPSGLTVGHHTGGFRTHHTQATRPLVRPVSRQHIQAVPVVRIAVGNAPAIAAGSAHTAVRPAVTASATSRATDSAPIFAFFSGWTSGAGAGSPAPIPSGGMGAAGAAVFLLLPLLGYCGWRRITPSSMRRPDEFVLGHLVPPG